MWKIKKHSINFEDIAKNILRNVPEQNKKYVKKQLDLLDENYLDYIFYWDEKYYRNGFVDGMKIVMGCVSDNVLNLTLFKKSVRFFILS